LNAVTGGVALPAQVEKHLFGEGLATVSFLDLFATAANTEKYPDDKQSGGRSCWFSLLSPASRSRAV
jgi:hypothetical protein